MPRADEPVVILSARRTPIGAFQGALAPLAAPALGSIATAAAVADAGVPLDAIDDAILGCCLFAGLKQAPARQAVLGAGLPDRVPCTTLSKMCGSGLRAITLIHDQLCAGSITVGLAGGMESMTNAPHLLTRARAGYRLGHGQLHDHLFLDGLEDAYEGQLMGYYADTIAEELGIGRAAQDACAAESVRRAQAAVASGAFDAEIAPVAANAGRARVALVRDETPATCDAERLASARAAFRPNGSVTAGNASSISDGAAALVLARQSTAAAHGRTPLARIVGHATHAQAPSRFTTAPAHAVNKLLAQIGWEVADVDLFEINEAFAVVALIARQALDIPADRLNVDGGACALGHPIGATGARLVVTLIHALRRRGLRRGIAALCIGGGEAAAIAIETG
ncbi:MAG: acetyl-CoA C-acyltransferase [Rhodocyclaceae bacterium]|nr:acetyl-CoA C-acyltransferase [Rhodocyclaceae bacterium]